ncbi:LOW QUALITY PROTEIN: hypothetical protein CRUP_014056, partial [Coryphaenoides rupestris]
PAAAVQSQGVPWGPCSAVQSGPSTSRSGRSSPSDGHRLPRHGPLDGGRRRAAQEADTGAAAGHQGHHVAGEHGHLQQGAQRGERRAVEAEGRVQGAPEGAQVHGGAGRRQAHQPAGSPQDGGAHDGEQRTQRPEERELARSSSSGAYSAERPKHSAEKEPHSAAAASRWPRLMPGSQGSGSALHGHENPPESSGSESSRGGRDFGPAARNQLARRRVPLAPRVHGRTVGWSRDWEVVLAPCLDWARVLLELSV